MFLLRLVVVLFGVALSVAAAIGVYQPLSTFFGDFEALQQKVESLEGTFGGALEGVSNYLEEYDGPGSGLLEKVGVSSEEEPSENPDEGAEEEVNTSKILAYIPLILSVLTGLFVLSIYMNLIFLFGGVFKAIAWLFGAKK